MLHNDAEKEVHTYLLKFYLVRMASRPSLTLVSG
jgi:hypothetical protein